MQPTLIETERKRRRGRPALRAGEGAVKATAKRRIIYMLEAGATITEIARTQGLPSLHAINDERRRDPEFDAAIRTARVVGLEIKLDLCAEHAEREAESRDPDRMRVAQMLSTVMTTYAEKIAPKEYGQLVKLGGGDGGPLAVTVINYAAVNGGALTPVDDDNPGRIARATGAVTAPRR